MSDYRGVWYSQRLEALSETRDLTAQGPEAAERIVLRELDFKRRNSIYGTAWDSWALLSHKLYRGKPRVIASGHIGGE